MLATAAARLGSEHTGRSLQEAVEAELGSGVEPLAVASRVLDRPIRVFVDTDTTTACVYLAK